MFPDEFSLNKSVGEISSEKLFRENAVGAIKEKLYFSVNYSKVNGETGNYTIKLKVNEFNTNETK